MLFTTKTLFSFFLRRINLDTKAKAKCYFEPAGGLKIHKSKWKKGGILWCKYRLIKRHSRPTDRCLVFFFPKTHIKPMMASGLGRMWNCTTQPSTRSADSALNSICEFCQLPRDSDYWRNFFLFVFFFICQI